MIKEKIKNHLFFAIQGFIINTLLYYIANLLLDQNDIIGAASITIAMIVNGFIYLIGCVKGLLSIIDEINQKE